MKINWYAVGFYAIIATALFLWGKKCGSDSVKSVGKDTATVRIDTLPGKVQVVIDTHYVPKPYLVTERDTVRIADTIPELVQIDTSQILIDYHRARFYSDTIPIDHGTAVINDTVSQNRIAGRGVKVSQQLPVIRETVTLYQPPKNIVYFGVMVQGGPQNYLFAAGADLSLKTKNDRIYSAGVSLTRDNQVLYQGGVRFPIHLRGRVFDRR